eukprot:gene3702-biopygen6570
MRGCCAAAVAKVLFATGTVGGKVGGKDATGGKVAASLPLAAWRQSGGTAWRQSGGMAAWRHGGKGAAKLAAKLAAWRHGGKVAAKLSGMAAWRQSGGKAGGKVAAWRRQSGGKLLSGSVQSVSQSVQLLPGSVQPVSQSVSSVAARNSRNGRTVAAQWRQSWRQSGGEAGGPPVAPLCRHCAATGIFAANCAGGIGNRVAAKQWHGGIFSTGGKARRHGGKVAAMTGWRRGGK